ncbi:hypothetical protein AVEN_221336-1 [Araneus ventricosus]|uniref:Uncharacterized protein n=1 Tax=Araneus ventricosus TaxID=182803 RepID=A0A4Y2AYF2_ARAVE|nr:hypothetical protein AVEN_221336-1 [Araneus ventricosus]
MKVTAIDIHPSITKDYPILESNIYRVFRNSTYKLIGEAENIDRNYNRIGKCDRKWIDGAVRDLGTCARSARAVPHCRRRPSAVNKNRFTNTELTDIRFWTA